MGYPCDFHMCSSGKKNATSSAVITAVLLSQAKKAKETEKVGPHVTEPWKSWLVGGQASPDGHKFQLSEIICQVSCAKFRGFGIQTINILCIDMSFDKREN